MPSDKAKIAKNAMLLYIRMGVVMVVGIYTSRVILQNLGVSDYGTYNVVGGIVSILGFATGALCQGIQRFYNYHKGRNDYDMLNKVFGSAFVIMAFFSIILMLFAETLGLWFLNSQLNIPADRMYAANWVFQFSILTAVLGLLATPFTALINAHEDFGIYAYLSIYSVVMNLFITMLVQISPIDKLIFYALFIALVQWSYLGLQVMIVRIKYKKVHMILHRDKSIYKSLLSFSGWNMLGVVSYVAVTTGMNMVLNIFFGTVVNAARGIAVQISGKIEQFVQNLQSAANPQIIQLYARNELDAVRSLIDDNFRWNISLFWLMSLPVILEIDYILSIWLVEVPEYTAVFVIIVLVRSLLKCFEGPINTLNFAIGKVKKLNIFSSTCTFAAFFLTIVLFKMGYPPYWGFLMDIIFICFVICYSIFMAGREGVYGLRRFAKHIFFPVLTVFAISLGATYCFQQLIESSILRLFLVLIFATIISSLSLFYIVYTKSNRQKILSLIANKITHK